MLFATSPLCALGILRTVAIDWVKGLRPARHNSALFLSTVLKKPVKIVVFARDQHEHSLWQAKVTFIHFSGYAK